MYSFRTDTEHHAPAFATVLFNKALTRHAVDTLADDPLAKTSPPCDFRNGADVGSNWGGAVPGTELSYRVICALRNFRILGPCEETDNPLENTRHFHRSMNTW